MSPRPCVAWVTVVALCATPVVPQIVTETTDVTLVEVPVQVTARGGEPARGLGISDFELYDCGHRQLIDSLEVIDVSPHARGREGDLPSVVRRRFLLLFDLTFSRPQAVVKARLAVRDFVLGALAPSDLVAVMIFTVETGPRFLVSFTSDRAQVARALDTLGTPSLLGVARAPDPLRLILENPAVGFEVGAGGGPPAEAPGGQLVSDDGRSAEVLAHLRSLDLQLERQHTSIDRGRVSGWARALSQLARVLADIGGRKHLFYFSEGFDSGLLLGRPEGVAPSAESVGGRESLEAERGEHWLRESGNLFGDAALRQDLRQVVDQLRRADAVVDAIDIGGLSTASSATRSGRRGALSAIARGTGGRLHESLNDLGALLGRAVESTPLTYLLSFHPRDLVADGSFHELEVRLVELAEHRVSHRAGYYAPRPFEALHPLEKSLLAADAIITATPRRDLEMALLLAPFRGGDRSFYVPVILEIDGPSLIDGQHSQHLETELFAYATNERGEMRDFFTHRVVLDLAKARERLAASGLKFYGHLSLGAGRFRVRVLARNAETGHTTVQTVPLAIPRARDSEPRLLPPFFLEQPGRWLLAREPADDERVIYPFTIHGRPFIPAVRPVLRRGEPAELLLVAYGLSAAPVRLASRLVAEDGHRPLGAPLELIERLADGAAGRVQLRARFDPRGLLPGSYGLEITVSEVAGDLSASSSVSLRVE